MTDTISASVDMREKVLDAASRLVAGRGADALTTRAVAAAAGTQGPTIYRLFGDKRGLLDALAERAMAHYVAGEQGALDEVDADPVQALRRAWDAHVAFGLAHPALYHLMSTSARGGALAPATLAGINVLHARVRRIAAAGRLKVAEERAVAMIHAAGTGTVIALLEQNAESRDLGLSEAMRDAVMAAITSDRMPVREAETPRLATALRARLGEDQLFSPGERLLLSELLSRLAE